jgi:hypothetical protein
VSKLVEKYAHPVWLREPNIPEVLRYRRSDAEFLGFIAKSGWKGELPYYRFKCTIHGYVENYPHGFESRLSCPYCPIY